MKFRDDVYNLMNAAHYAAHYAADNPFPEDCDSIDSAVDDVNALVRRALEHRRLLQEHRNTLIPAARLPPEILSHVFRYCAPTPACEVVDVTTLAFSQVCLRWRRIALQDANIWTTPICIDPRMCETMLSRTKDLPLNVTIGYSSKSSDVARVALIRFPQLAQLDLTADLGDFQKLISLITDTMPFLTELALRAPWDSGPVDLQNADFTAPNLHRLCLERCLPLPNAKIFQNLTVLELIFTSFTLPPIDRPDLIYLAKQNPQLQRLVCRGITFNQSVPFSPLGSKTILQCLETLEVHIAVHHMRMWFQYFSFPNLKQLSLSNEYWNRETSIVEIRSFLALINQWLVFDSRFTRVTSFEVAVDSNDLAFDVKCEEEVQTGEALSICTMLHLFAFLPEALECLSRTFRLDDVVEASIKSEGPDDLMLPLQPMMTVLAALPHVASLRSSDNAWSSWVDVMESTEWNGPEPPFRCLNSLHLFDPVMFDTGGGDDLSRFARVLQRLTEAGRPIGDVRIMGLKSDVDTQDLFTEMGLRVLLEDAWILEPSDSDGYESSS